PDMGTRMSGALSVVSVPAGKTLKESPAKVYRTCPYSDEQLTAAPHGEKTAIPTKVGELVGVGDVRDVRDASPIKYVIYIIKENRTYDQVFGDLAAGANPKGKGDPALCMFPRKATPKHHN